MDSRWNFPLNGSCLCGKIRFEITQNPMLTLACHCKGCQQMTASAFSLTVAVPSNGFEITKGKPIIGGLHKPQSRYYHCDWCKNWIFTQPRPDIGFTSVRAMMLDDTDWFEPYIEVWTTEKLSWVTIPAKHSFESQPKMSAYAPIIDEFAELQ